MADPQSHDDEARTWPGSSGESHAGSRGLRPQLIVSNRYRVGSLLGAGGMGLVYEAEHLGLGLPVAIKVLRPELIARQGMIARFHQEARCTARLRGEHVVRVLDEGRLETGLPYFIMERLYGLDLRAMLRACSLLPAALTVNYARQACAALAEAHATGIIHRDVKPSNLFVTSQTAGHSRIKLLDFGIAQQGAPDDDDEQLGTSSYASPEQLDAADAIDERSDLWSLGVVMFEALTGRLPLVDGWFGRRRLDLRPLERGSEVPEGLRSVIRRCLTEDRAARFGSAAEVARALEPFAIPHCDAPALPPSACRTGAESRYRSNGFGASQSLARDVHVMHSFPLPRRTPARPRPILQGASHRA